MLYGRHSLQVLALAGVFMSEQTQDQINRTLQLYAGLTANIQTKTSSDTPLLLAHYTSVEVVEQILKHEELWFSNPLYMNDLEEMRLGIFVGSQLFPQFAQAASKDEDHSRRLVECFNHFMAHLDAEAALDTYVFCLSEHDHDNRDGLLSMWREYGSKGNGAALVFNTQKLHYQPHSPILIAKVIYASYDERRRELEARLADWARITLEANPASSDLYLAAYAAFDFVKSFALTTKHRGFSEEREWRAIYVPERDPLGYLKGHLDYSVGPRGVEPKLKFKFGDRSLPRDGQPGEPLTTQKLSDILEFIMLGPSASSPLAQKAFIRMLQRNNKADFGDRVIASTIPLRPQL